MKILVVDDEQVMLDSICYILTNEPDLQIETARTGRQAIEKTEIFRPELIIMDLKMPGINGLEALTEIRRLDPQAVLIILSAYENFLYAQEAIRLNVYDYLVKPITKKRLLELINKVKQHLEKVREKRQEELALQERYKKLFPLIENELMIELIHGADEMVLGEYQELLTIKSMSGFFLAISCYDKSDATIESDIELGYLRRKRMAELAEEIRQVVSCFVGPLKSNPISVFVPSNNDFDAISSSRDIALKILNHLQLGRKQADIRIGIGRTYSFASELKRSCQESFQALNHPGPDPISHIDEAPQSNEEDWESALNDELHTMLDAIRYGNVNKVRSLIEQFSQNYRGLSAHKDRLFLHLLEFILTAYRIGKENSKSNKSLFPSFEQIINLFGTSKDLEVIFNEIFERIVTLTQSIQEGSENQVKSIIKQAKEIIDRQFTEQLNLEDISHMVSISPFYFSRLFRKELGISFCEYLTKLRLKKAVDLLAEGFSVKECCFMAGYKDPNYFSRIFRKYYNISPSEYRDEQIRLKGDEVPK